MQDPTSITTSTPSFPELKNPQLQFPEQEQLKCPRCDSNNTKFCYYNNYNLSQPRHYCKNCRRYWTKGGALRNIPIGGGSRKNTKRSSSKRSSSSCSSLAQAHISSSGLSLGSAQNSESETKPGPILGHDVIGSGLGLTGEGVGSFTSLLGMAAEGQFGNLEVEGLGSNGLWLGQGDGPGQNPGLELIEGNNGGDHQSCWVGSNNNNVWPDLAIYTQPGSKF